MKVQVSDPHSFPPFESKREVLAFLEERLGPFVGQGHGAYQTLLGRLNNSDPRLWPDPHARHTARDAVEDVVREQDARAAQEVTS